MRKLAIAAVIAAGTLASAAPAANASESPVQVCASISEMFETANVQAPPTHPLVGTAYRAVCKVTG